MQKEFREVTNQVYVVTVLGLSDEDLRPIAEHIPLNLNCVSVIDFKAKYVWTPKSITHLFYV